MTGRCKFTSGDRVIGNDRKASFRDRIGTVIEHGPGTSEYWVMFEDGREECVESSWINPA